MDIASETFLDDWYASADEKWLKSGEAAACLGTSRSTVRRLAIDGRIRYWGPPVFTHMRYHADDVLDLRLKGLGN